MTDKMGFPRAGLPDPAGSRAVLVGVSKYTTQPDLPAVANNITTLEQVLTDPELWGLPREHCTTLLNPTSPVEVVQAVHRAAAAAQEALVFYFAGHGLLDERSELFLALPDADKDQLFLAVRYDDIRQQVVETALGCYGKVVLLDCCFSGRALVGHMGGPAELADHARADGTYLMTASAETVEAQAPPDEKYTAFTGVLLDKLLNGLPDGRDVIDMETLFHHVRADLKAQLRPVPQQRTRNEGSAIALVRNRRRSAAAAATPVPTVRELPQPPTGSEPFLRRPPRIVMREVDTLRTEGSVEDADQLLAACAARRPDQEVAAIIGLLRHDNRHADLRQVIDAVTLRSPTEVLHVAEALTDIDLAAESGPLLRAAGASAVTDVAEMARLLRAGDRTAELTTLLDAARDRAQTGSSLIGLINALWVAGLREEVDNLIAAAASTLSSEERVSLADELRAVGREQAAFGLYAMSANALAARPTADIAQLCQAMTEATYPNEADQIAAAKIGTATDANEFLDIVSAFWHLDQNVHAGQTLAHAATTLPTLEILTLAGELRAIDRDTAGYDLCVRAAVNRSAADIMEIVAGLRDEGRPVDAKNVLATVATKAPWATMSELLGMCTDAERQRLLGMIVDRPAHEVSEVLATIGGQNGSPLTKDQLLEQSATTGDATAVTDLLFKLPTQDADLLFFLVVQTGGERLDLVAEALRQTSGNLGPDPVRTLLARQSVQHLAATLPALSGTGLDSYVDVVLANASRSTAGITAVTTHVADLQATGHTSAATELVHRFLSGRSHRQLHDLVIVLRNQGQSRTLTLIAEWVRTDYASMGKHNVTETLRQLGITDF